MERIYSKYKSDPEDVLEYGWVFGITFFLVLFLSQTLSIWFFGEVGSIFSWALLLTWSYVVSYFLLFGSGKYFLDLAKEGVDKFIKKKYLSESRASIKRVPELSKMELKPKEEKNEEVTQDLLNVLEQKAHEMGALISRDALVYISEFGPRGEGVLKNVIEIAKKDNPRFDGWVVLNKEQIIEVTKDETKNNYVYTEAKKSRNNNLEDEELYLGDIDRKNNVMVPANLPVGKLQSKNATATASFMQHLCEGDEQGLFTFIRKMRQGSEEEVRLFITDAILMLDRVHEHRVDGSGYVDRQVLEHTKCFSNIELEEIIAILIGSVDYRYSIPEIGIKLSLIRALEYIKKARKK